MRIIDTVQQKIKGIVEHPFYEMVLWSLIIFFIGMGAFALGMKYEQQRQKERYPVEMKYNPAAVELWENYQEIKQENQFYFASKNGTVVYPVGCTKGDRIKEENKIFFQEVSDAIELGYREVEGC